MSTAHDDFTTHCLLSRERASARAPQVAARMKLRIRVLFGAALLAGCASTTPRIDQPLVLDFRWKPPFTEETSGFGKPKVLQIREELIGLFIRQNFEITFDHVVAGDDPEAPARVELTVTEYGRPMLRTSRAIERCGTVEYAVFVSGTERTRETFPLDCDSTGDADYQRAGLRAAEAAARVVGANS
jgi:hypothetical protein